MRKINKKKWVVISILFIIVLIFILFFYQLRSYLVMSLYSQYNLKTSVMKNEGFVVDVKGGASTAQRDWYPFVNTYDTTYEFSNYMNDNLSLSVIYNFGAFKGKSSSFYDERSDYFAAFYGAYIIKDVENPEDEYGFNDGTLDIDEIAKVPLFDYKYLVIQDMGCRDLIFEIIEHKLEYGISYIGYDDWVKIDAKMIANSPSHIKKENMLGYIQYGLPFNKTEKEDFYDINLYGRMYARYFKEYHSTIVIYVMGANEEMLKECDDEILKKTIIRDRK